MDILPIDTGQKQASFKYFTVPLQAGEVKNIDNPFTCFRCYDATANFKLAWVGNTDFTDFGEGMMVKFEGKPLQGVKLYNPNNVAIVVKFGIGIGYFEDSRLSVSGSIQTVQGEYDAFTATTQTIASGSTTIAAGHNIIQNTGSNIMYIGGTGTDGLQLQPQGVFEINFAGTITIYGTNGDTVAIGSLV